MTARPPAGALGDAAHRRRSRSSSSWVSRTASGLVAATAGALCLALAFAHPLSGSWAALASVLLAAMSARWPRAWLVAVPAALPAIGGMPWTGWLMVEELDLLVLAMAAGAYARLALRRPATAAAATSPSATALKAVVVAAYAAALTVSMLRGFVDAGGLAWGWWQGYQEPLNSARLAKPLLLALLLLPLWRRSARAEPHTSAELLSVGLAAGLAVGGALALWERLAFPGLLDFATDYRTTALFWEMHVGGAAFDGFLALTMPFALHQLQHRTSGARWALAAVALALGVYACLTTFSRGVYLAVPLALGVQWALHARQTRRHDASAADSRPVAFAMLLVVFCAFALWLFSGSGYRGLLAWLGAFALLLPVAGGLRGATRGTVAGGLAGGVALTLTVSVLGWTVPKGPYVVYAFAWCASLAVLIHARYGRRRLASGTSTGALLAVGVLLLVSMPMVAGYWGGAPAVLPMVAAALALAALAGVGSTGAQPRWPPSWRWQGGVVAALGTAALLVGVLAGGPYMTERFGTTSQDLGGRVQHWRQALMQLQGPLDWAFGKGTGRYPANHRLSGRPEDQTGDYRLQKTADSGSYLTLGAGKHVQGWGELFRMSQRVDEHVGPVTVTLMARGSGPASLHVEVCPKHLLYDGAGCRTATHAVAGSWRPIRLQLPGPAADGGAWYAPRFLVFSLAVASEGTSIDIDDVRATDAVGGVLLHNGDFEQGLSRWFFSSDRHHMPWHIKSLLMHLLYEQGVVGLLLWCALAVAAAWRLTCGKARSHALAPALAAALIGVLVVGLFDSLLDVPRVAFLHYLLLFVALTVQAVRVHPRAPYDRPPGQMDTALR